MLCKQCKSLLAANYLTPDDLDALISCCMKNLPNSSSQSKQIKDDNVRALNRNANKLSWQDIIRKADEQIFAAKEKIQVGERRSKRTRKKTLKCLENEKLEKVKVISAILRSEKVKFSEIPIYFTPNGRNLNRPYRHKKLNKKRCPSKRPQTDITPKKSKAEEERQTKVDKNQETVIDGECEKTSGTEKEDNFAVQKKRRLESYEDEDFVMPNKRRLRSTMVREIFVGDTLECLYSNGETYPCEITCVRKDGTYDVKWEDGDQEERFGHPHSHFFAATFQSNSVRRSGRVRKKSRKGKLWQDANIAPTFDGRRPEEMITMPRLWGSTSGGPGGGVPLPPWVWTQLNRQVIKSNQASRKKKPTKKKRESLLPPPLEAFN